MLGFAYALVIIWSSLSSSTGQQCRNDFGESVDWIVAYKPPAQGNQKNFLLRKGIGYFYMSSKNSTSNWKLSVRAINMSNSFLGETLAPLYDIHAKNLLYIMYNDEPPFKAASSVFGHSKGVVVTDGQVGMWLIHSTPKFPIETFRSLDSSTLFERKNKTYKYFFPLSGKKYGQSFLCITLTSSQMNKVGIALQYIRPKVYDFNVPVDLNKQFANLSAVAKNEYIKQAPWYIKTVLESQGGTEFVSYAKAKQFNKDLYNDWLTEDLQSSLQVETWSNGPNYLPSNCKKKFHVMDVEDIQIRAADNQTVSFKNSQDHSKWAVTFNNNASIVCIGDINRMLSQFKRGGGAICFKNDFVWSRYSKAIVDVEPCSVKPEKKNY